MMMKSVLNHINPKNGVRYMEFLTGLFGLKFMLMISSTYFFIKGAMYYFVNAILLPYYKAARVSGSSMQLNNIIVKTPWSLKGLIGVVSDLIPLFGYHRRYYLIISSIVGTAVVILMVFVPLETVYLYPELIAVLLSLVMLQGAVFDLLMEGKYVIMMKKKPESRSMLVSYVWFIQMVGQIFPSLLVGFLSDIISPRYLFIAFIPVAAQPLIFLYTGCLVDDRAAVGTSNRIDVFKFRMQKKPIILAILISIGAVGTAVLGFFNINNILMLCYAVGICTLVAIIAFLTLPRLLAKIMLFMLLQMSLYVDITGALDYYYVADTSCIRDAPHFDYTYYRTYVGLAGGVASLLGVYCFQTFLSNMKLWWTFIITTVLIVVASIFDLVLVERWNIALGISDKTMYMFGDAVIYNMVYMMNFLPSNVLIAKLCPKTIETTIYAILAGFSNYGQSVAGLLGLTLIDWLNVKTLPDESGPCDFSNLSKLIIISHGILPICSLIFLFLLIPYKSLNDDFLGEEEDDTEVEDSPIALTRMLDSSGSKD